MQSRKDSWYTMIFHGVKFIICNMILKHLLKAFCIFSLNLDPSVKYRIILQCTCFFSTDLIWCFSMLIFPYENVMPVTWM